MFGFFAGRWRPLLYCVFAFYESNLTYVTVPIILKEHLTMVKNSQASLLFILLINIYVKNSPLHLIILK